MNEQILIDYDELREAIYSALEDMFVTETDNCKLNSVLDTIDEQPTVDAVPVVRCKDCKWYEPIESMNITRKNEYRVAIKIGYEGACRDIEKGRNKSDFCSHGERKESEVNDARN